MQTKVPQPSKKSPQRNFRPWPQNQMHFEFAEKAGFNVSEILNEVVAKHFRRQCEAKVYAQQQAIKSLAPARSSKPQLTKSRN